MSKRREREIVSDDGTYVVKKNRKMNIVAFVLCFLVSLVIWIYATNTENKDKKEQAEAQSTAAAEITVRMPQVVSAEDGMIGAEA